MAELRKRTALIQKLEACFIAAKRTPEDLAALITKIEAGARASLDRLPPAFTVKTGEQYAACAESRGAAGFNANGVIDGSRRVFCFPSVKACEANLTDARSNPDLTVAAIRCGIYRVQKSAP